MSDLLGRFLGDWNALLVLLIAGFLPNEIWRMLGLWLGGGVDEGSELLVWVRAVATAILAGRHCANSGVSTRRAGKRAGLAALRRGGGRIRGLYRDPAFDFRRRGLRRGHDADRQVVARLRRARARRSALRPSHIPLGSGNSK
jgi:hypothetical protein